MPAGVRVAMRTDAATFSVALEGDKDSCPVDVLVDGELHARLPVGRGPGMVTTDLPMGHTHVEAWMPQWGRTRVGIVRLAGHGFVEPVHRDGPRWVTYGSSITQGREADGPSETWPALVARRHGWRLTCLGFGGECHLDPVVARTIRDGPADLVSLCLGINVYGRASFGPRTFAPAVSRFVETVRDGHPAVPIVVVTPITAPDREDRRNAAGMTLAEVREQVDVAVRTLRRLGDADLHLIDGLWLLGKHDVGLLADGLHPSAEGHRFMADRVAPLLGQAPGR